MWKAKGFLGQSSTHGGFSTSMLVYMRVPKYGDIMEYHWITPRFQVEKHGGNSNNSMICLKGEKSFFWATVMGSRAVGASPSGMIQVGGCLHLRPGLRRGHVHSDRPK